MTPEDDRLIADLVSPLVSRAEALALQVTALTSDIVSLEGELRRRLSDCKARVRWGLRTKGGHR